MIVFGLLITGFLTILPLMIPSVLAASAAAITAQEQDEELRQSIQASLARRGFTADLNQILAQNQSMICDIDDDPLTNEESSSTLIMDTAHNQAERICY